MSQSEATSVRTGDIVKSDGTTLFVVAGPNDQVWLVNPNYYGPVYVLHAKKGFDCRLPEGCTIVRRADRPESRHERMKHACRQPGAPEMVDVHTPTEIKAALACCARCPVFAACRHELDSQPPEHQPYGVTAGRVLIDRDAKRMRSTWSA